MKIVITENQMDKFIQKLRMGIEKHGFNDTAKMTGFNKLKLAELSGLPIKGDTFHNENEITVGNLLRDLVNQNREYETCTLHYEGMSGIVEWNCNFMDDENYYRLTIAATPYWDGHNTTPIDMFNVEVTPINSPEDKREFDTTSDYLNEFDSPKSFENASELMDWFKDEYIPKTYDIIVKSLEDFKEREL